MLSFATLYPSLSQLLLLLQDVDLNSPMLHTQHWNDTHLRNFYFKLQPLSPNHKMAAEKQILSSSKLQYNSQTLPSPNKPQKSMTSHIQNSPVKLDDIC